MPCVGLGSLSVTSTMGFFRRGLREASMGRERLRREGTQLLEQEQEDVLTKLENLFISTKEKVEPILKVKWSKEKKAYSSADLREVFFKYGALANIVMDKRKPTALVEFKDIESARMAFNIEKGLEENPLTLKALFDKTSSKEVFPKYLFEGVSADPVQYLDQMDLGYQYLVSI